MGHLIRPIQCPECAGVNYVETDFTTPIDEVKKGSTFDNDDSIQCSECRSYFLVEFSSEELELFFLSFLREMESFDYIPFRFSTDIPLLMEYNVIVRRGPPVELHLFTPEEFEFFQNGDRFRTVYDDQRLINGEDSFICKSGEYVVSLSTIEPENVSHSGNIKVDAEFRGYKR